MKLLKPLAAIFVILVALNSCTETSITSEPSYTPDAIVAENNETETSIDTIDAINTDQMKLGAFSISLNVKDLTASKEFYEKFGFSAMGGAMESNYLIMKNGNSIIGLFQGMFENNILTFNPGWNENAENMESFDDIRKIQKHLISEGIETGPQIDSSSTGPASMMITDPDGNVILMDQHR